MSDLSYTELQMALQSKSYIRIKYFVACYVTTYKAVIINSIIRDMI